MSETIDPSGELRQKFISNKVRYTTNTIRLNNEMVSVMDQEFDGLEAPVLKAADNHRQTAQKSELSLFEAPQSKRFGR